MTFYELDGTRELAPLTYDGSVQGSENSWRLFTALVLVLLLSVGTLVSKTFASVQDISQPVLPTNFVLAAQPEPRPVEPLPAIVTPPDRSPELKDALMTWQAKQVGSDWGFYVKSLDNNGLSVGINDTTQFEMASIYKLFLLGPLADKLPTEAWANNSIAGRTYLDCVHDMLAVSDNPCAEAIAGQLGWSALDRRAKAEGYTQTVLNRSDFFVSSPADAGLLLSRLHRGEGFDAKTRELALNALGKVKRAEAIRRGCAGCTVYNKTGEFNRVKHDAAIVQKGGKTYVVVVFSERASWQQLAEAANIINQYL